MKILVGTSLDFKNKCQYFFETNEEIKIFADFLYNNDYFIRKEYKNISDYRNYIKDNINSLYIDSEYHIELIAELYNTIDNYKRKTNLIILKISYNGKQKKFI
jgi:hypothetical protein